MALAEVGFSYSGFVSLRGRYASPAGPYFLLSRHILAKRGERPQDGPKGEAKGRVKESKQRKGDDGVG